MTTYAYDLELVEQLGSHERGASNRNVHFVQTLTFVGSTGDVSFARAERYTTFKQHADRWELETVYVSSPREKFAHPDYQSIIDMDDDAVRFILKRMVKRPHMWFAALRDITGENPVAQENRGNVDAMTRDWLAWGIDHGYYLDT